MTTESFLAFLLVAAICALLALVAGLVVRVRRGPLALVGAGLLGRALGDWVRGLASAGSLLRVEVAGAVVDLGWAFLGALVVMVLVRLSGRLRAG